MTVSFGRASCDKCGSASNRDERTKDSLPGQAFSEDFTRKFGMKHTACCRRKSLRRRLERSLRRNSAHGSHAQGPSRLMAQLIIEKAANNVETTIMVECRTQGEKDSLESEKSILCTRFGADSVRGFFCRLLCRPGFHGLRRVGKARTSPAWQVPK